MKRHQKLFKNDTKTPLTSLLTQLAVLFALCAGFFLYTMHYDSAHAEQKKALAKQKSALSFANKIMKAKPTALLTPQRLLNKSLIRLRIIALLEKYPNVHLAPPDKKKNTGKKKRRKRRRKKKKAGVGKAKKDLSKPWVHRIPGSVYTIGTYKLELQGKYHALLSFMRAFLAENDALILVQSHIKVSSFPVSRLSFKFQYFTPKAEKEEKK